MGRLLVVDDEELVRACISALLAVLGYSVIETGNGEEALRVYQTLRAEIILVLMDVNMPMLDGVSTARLIREVNPHAKIVLMSGNLEQDEWKATSNGFIAKPFTGPELHQVVQEVLKDPVSQPG